MIDIDNVVAEAKKRRPWRVAGQMYRSFVPPVPGSFEWNNSGEYVHVQHFDNLIAAIEQLQARKSICSCCGGEGVTTSGLPCICKGIGTSEAEAQGLREHMYELQIENEKLQAEQREESSGR